MTKGDLSFLAARLRSLRAAVEAAVIAEWPGCILPLVPDINPNTREDPITRQLYMALVRTKRVPGRFVPQYEILQADPAGVVGVIGRIDLILTVGDREDVYLACECKRLNVPRDGRLDIGNGAYVDEGLIKFIDRRYSRGLPSAMMIGYTLNGDIGAATASLERMFEARKAIIGFKSISHEPIVPGYRRFTTIHERPESIPIELSHTMLPWT
jgi:hypothetical protein